MYQVADVHLIIGYYDLMCVCIGHLMQTCG